MLAFSPMAL